MGLQHLPGKLNFSGPVKPELPNASFSMLESSSARICIQRIEALGKISEVEGILTRTFCSDAMRKANKLVGGWMREAGMAVRVDAIGNLIGHFPGRKIKGSTEKILLIGSHLDTVRNAGKFDGPLGVLVGIACVQSLKDRGIELPFAVEVVGFADEEGVRYHSTYLGSRAMAGTFDSADLRRVDAKGVTMEEAIRRFGGNPKRLNVARLDPRKLLGYIETHIEQGPVLEKKNLAVGVVSGIAGQTRAHYRFHGQAGHAGTVPMNLRHDALCAAAEFVLAVESFAKGCPGLVATVGQTTVEPGASNVIPGSVTLSLDLRHGKDRVREEAFKKIHTRAVQIAKKRGVRVEKKIIQQTKAVECDSEFVKMLGQAMKKHQPKSALLPSGAGHDAAAMSAITPVGMLFVRCKGGISHHPDEFASVKDIGVAISVMNDFIQLCAERLKT